MSNPRRTLERRLYELARKQCGTQPEWKCGLEKLQARTGSTSSEKEFKRLVKAICKADESHNHMPDYSFRLLADILIVSPKREFLQYGQKLKQDTSRAGISFPCRPMRWNGRVKLRPHGISQFWQTSGEAIPRSRKTRQKTPKGHSSASANHGSSSAVATDIE